MASENKLRDWVQAIMKVLEEGSSDPSVKEFTKFIDGKASALNR
jgi:hypothetical protein